MKLKPFLDKYHTIIFDLDGVITQESAYWDAAALVVYQEINAQKFLDDAVDVEYYSTHVKEIRKEVFCDDELIAVFKNKGVNSNWDLAYITYAIAVLLETKDFTKVLEYAENMSDDIFAEYAKAAEGVQKRFGIADASRGSKFWEDIQMRFQEWVLGDARFLKVYGYEASQKGKPALLDSEEPVVDGEKLKEVIAELYNSGKILAVATGRVYEEAASALERFGIMEYFDRNHIINFDHVVAVQKNLGVQVTKPHPYMFQKAYLGNVYSDKKILADDFDKEGIKGVLVVGDAGADILGAKAMGADFCGVLTGVSGAGVKPLFEELKAEHILNNMLEFEE